jgi:hypothetical protein
VRDPVTYLTGSTECVRLCWHPTPSALAACIKNVQTRSPRLQPWVCRQRPFKSDCQKSLPSLRLTHGDENPHYLAKPTASAVDLEFAHFIEHARAHTASTRRKPGVWSSYIYVHRRWRLCPKRKRRDGHLHATTPAQSHHLRAREIISARPRACRNSCRLKHPALAGCFQKACELPAGHAA